MGATFDVVVVGAGLFGLTAALELRARGHRVAVVDPGPLPHPLAASTDVAKVVRLEYGPDDAYAELAERARAGWLRWNDEWFGDQLYHEVGFMLLSRRPMAPGGYEYENYHALLRRGHRPERLTSAAIADRFPAWNAEVYVDGYLNPDAGYVESGLVIARLAERAASEGIILRLGAPVTAIVEQAGRVTGARAADGEVIAGGGVLLAIGAWTPALLPELAPAFRIVGQPIFHLKPADPALFTPPRFAVFGADGARTGWYGFPVHPRAGIVKIAHHGRGWPVDPAGDERPVPESFVPRLRAFLAETFPALAGAPLVATRGCLYCDTPDQHFWIAPHPERPGLTVAAGDSGHAFKFAPVLGEIIADAVEGRANPLLDRFRWRTFAAGVSGQEWSRYHGE
jgi:glycine/D-amino acid oxidase-like deaminating enzyme